MAEVSNDNTRKRKGFLPTDDSVHVTSAEKSKGRVGVVQQPDTEYQMKTDDELEKTIKRIKKNLLTIGHKLPDKGEKLKAVLRRCVAELVQRKRSCIVKVCKSENIHVQDEREKEDDVKRMRRLRDELEAEKKLTNQVKFKLVDSETKNVQLEARVVDLQKKLCDLSVQLDAVEEENKELAKRLEIAERKWADVDDDSKWLLQEGLPFLVKRLVNELSKENFMTVSELRALHQRSRSDSS